MTRHAVRALIGAEEGMFAVRADQRCESVRLPDAQLAALAPHRNASGEQVIYAVGGRESGTLYATAIDPTGRMRSLGMRASVGGTLCDLTVAADASAVLVANYADASVTVYALEPDGRIGSRTQSLAFAGSGPVTGRQDAAHVHQVLLMPGGQFVVVTDLGSDTVYSCRWDGDERQLRRARPPCVTPAGSGPRQLVFQSDTTALGVDELSSTVSEYHFDHDTGELRWLRRTPIGRNHDRTGPNYPSAIALSADRRYAYIGNRGTDSISVVTVADLLEIGQFPSGGSPQHLARVDGRLWCAVGNDEVASWMLDPIDGTLSDRRHEMTLARPRWILPIDSDPRSSTGQCHPARRTAFVGSHRAMRQQ